MPAIPPSESPRQLALLMLGAYLVASSSAHAANMMQGAGDGRFALVAMLLIYATYAGMKSTHGIWRRVGDWLPLLSLPPLYAGLRWSMLGGGVMHDAVVQSWDRALFGGEPARTLAGAMPWRALSELLHLAYFSYYGIIFIPALVLYLRAGEEQAFHRLVLAFTVTMVASFVVFTVFPVAGPRYEWLAPAGVPSGPVRSVVLSVLEAGSTRGTAFPSSHVAISMAIALAALREHRLAGGVLVTLTVLLGLGAVYGGFHYATDIVAGMALGVGCWGISTRLNWRSFGPRV